MFRAGIFVLLNIVFLSGCASRGNVELLENQLRHQEDELYSLQNNLEVKEQSLKSAKREVRTLQAQLSSKTQTVSYPEQTHIVSQAEGIRFNKLRTGGLNEDGQKGDDVLSAVLVPFDGSDDLIKLPGEIEFRLYDLSKPKNQQKLGQWKFDPEETSEHWHKSFLASGYLFKLPWQKYPTSEQLTLVARFRTPDGRTFQTNHVVKIEPPSGANNFQNVSSDNQNQGYLPTQNRTSNQRRENSLTENSVNQTAHRIEPKQWLKLTPSDRSDAKSQPQKRIQTSNSIRKFDNLRYQ